MTTTHLLLALVGTLVLILLLARWSQRRYWRRDRDRYWEGP